MLFITGLHHSFCVQFDKIHDNKLLAPSLKLPSLVADEESPCKYLLLSKAKYTKRLVAFSSLCIIFSVHVVLLFFQLFGINPNLQSRSPNMVVYTQLCNFLDINDL